MKHRIQEDIQRVKKRKVHLSQQLRANAGQIYIFMCNFYFIQNENRFIRSLRGKVYFYDLDYLYY